MNDVEQWPDDRRAKEIRTQEVIAKIRAKKALPKCENCRFQAWLLLEGQNKLQSLCRQPWISDLDVNAAGHETRQTVYTKKAREDSKLCGVQGDVYEQRSRALTVWLWVLPIFKTLAVMALILGIVVLVGFGLWHLWLWGGGVTIFLLLLACCAGIMIFSDF